MDYFRIVHSSIIHNIFMRVYEIIFEYKVSKNMESWPKIASLTGELTLAELTALVCPHKCIMAIDLGFYRENSDEKWIEYWWFKGFVALWCKALLLCPNGQLGMCVFHAHTFAHDKSCSSLKQY